MFSDRFLIILRICRNIEPAKMFLYTRFRFVSSQIFRDEKKKKRRFPPEDAFTHRLASMGLVRQSQVAIRLIVYRETMNPANKRHDERQPRYVVRECRTRREIIARYLLHCCGRTVNLLPHGCICLPPSQLQPRMHFIKIIFSSRVRACVCVRSCA